MTEEEFRADLLAAVASRAEVEACGTREAFSLEMLDRLSASGEVPDAESCVEVVTGQRARKLEIDAWAMDDADGSLHLFVTILDGRAKYPPNITLTDARDQGFNRVLGVFEQARDGWLTANIEESRPLWALARRIQIAPLPTALRVHVLTDRPINERLREIAGQQSRENVPVTFQIWDVTRLKRIHDALSVRDDLIVDFSSLKGGGLPVLPASVGSGEYEGYLAVIPGEALAEIYIRHGSRLLEGNVRTFLGRSGKVNKGIATTVAKEPAKFFAYNNGIAATASTVTTVRRRDGSLILTAASDLQIVNGAQTTASLATAQRDKVLAGETVFVPMKLSVVTPAVAADLIPRISRFANSQNGVRPSDFFANHEFHRRIEEVSRRVLAPAVAGSQVQTHWYYERARGQHLNDQAGLTAARRNQFLLINPRRQVIAKTDLSKVECCFNLEPDIACKGAEKAFVAFAERISKEWTDESRRAIYGDDWFKSAVARLILFRATESSVSKATWYEGGYRAQIVAYTCARLSKLALDQEESGGLDYMKIWAQQSAGEVLEQQIAKISEVMIRVLQNPPLSGQNISEWAKLQACRSTSLETVVPMVKGFDDWILTSEDRTARRREQRATGLIDRGLDCVKRVLSRESRYWNSLREFGRANQMLLPDDEKALLPACRIPNMVPTDRQAARVLQLADRAAEAGWQYE
jgi:AIPR protein